MLVKLRCLEVGLPVLEYSFGWVWMWLGQVSRFMLQRKN